MAPSGISVADWSEAMVNIFSLTVAPEVTPTLATDPSKNITTLLVLTKIM